MHAAGLLDAHDGAHPAGLDVLDDDARLGGQLDRATPRRPSPVAPEHVAAVPVRHGGEATRRRRVAWSPAFARVGPEPVDLALRARECQHPRAAVRSRRPGGDHVMSEDRRLRVLRAIVQDYVQTSEPVGSKALLERHHLGVSRGHRAQRHGRARGGGPDRRAAHQRRAGAHRRRLPPVRRPALGRQADERRRAARHRPVPRGRRRPRRRRRPHRAPARLADPPGRRRAVPVAGPLVGAPRRARADRRRAPARRAHHQHRPGRAAGHRRSAPTCSPTTARAPCRPVRTELNRATSRAHAHRGGQPSSRPCPTRLDPAQRDLVRRDQHRARGRPRRGARGARRARRHGQPRPGRPRLHR